MDAINGDSLTPKRRKLTDFFPEVPASEGLQQFRRFLRQYQPTDVPRRLARPKRSVGRPRSDSQTPESPRPDASAGSTDENSTARGIIPPSTKA